ncbi:MAG: acyltransferase [Armatimonadetes bacterium]|nr:acyltransferase [Armatimonadota bacterium]
MPSEPAPQAPPPNRVPILDGLRGVAVALVVLFHVWQISWLDYRALLHFPVDISFLPATGFFGVDLFFFLSAFCLTLPYARAWVAGTPAPTLRHFATRRVAKIVPSYYLAIAILWWLPQTGIAPGREWFHLLTHLLFVHNWFFETSGSISGVLWSLAAEAQFYVLFPFLILVLRRFPLVTVSGMVLIAVVWRLVSLRIFFVTDPGESILAWRGEQLPARFDVFAAGMAAAYAHVRTVGKPWAARFALGFAFVAVAAFGLVLWQMQICYVNSVAGVPLDVMAMRGRLALSGTLFVLGYAGSLAPHGFQKSVANPVFAFLSVVSYNLYLWHQPVAAWLRTNNLPPASTSDPHHDPAWQFWFTGLAWAAAIAVASLLTWGWETPFLRGGWARIRRKR